jgi:LmbE family N-acetylglucosaminyl deacetylase
LPSEESALPFLVDSVDPADFLAGTVLIAAPHQDDEILACGGTIARLPDKTSIHVVYATDGRRSPAPVLPWRDTTAPDLDRIRMDEACTAMGHLGVPAENLRFLALPDGGLRHYLDELTERLGDLAARIRPAHVLVPFRYDRHTDHLALNRVAIRLLREGRLAGAAVTEYFVYYRWRLLPRGDVRAYIRPGLLAGVEIHDVSRLKRQALDRFRSQTTRFYSWQDRPNLTSTLLDEVSRTPEIFVRYDPSLPGAKVFSASVAWICTAHRLEPGLKKVKDQAVAWIKRGFAR